MNVNFRAGSDNSAVELGCGIIVKTDNRQDLAMGQAWATPLPREAPSRRESRAEVNEMPTRPLQQENEGNERKWEWEQAERLAGRKQWTGT